MELHLIITIYIFTLVKSESNTCHRNVKSKNGTYRKEVYCCNNHQMENGVCVECKPGSIARSGERCNACAENTYGRRCAFSCNCNKDYARCDNVVGCVNKTITTNTEDASTTFTYSSRLSEASFTTSKEHFSQTDSEKYKDQENPNQSLLHPEIVYTIATAGLLFIIIIVGNICFCCNRSKKIRRKTTLNQTTVGDQNVSTTPNHNNLEQTGYIYDEIDENRINDLQSPSQSPMNDKEEVMNDSSDDDETVSVKSGYLNPYQSVIEEPYSHDYKEINRPKKVKESNVELEKNTALHYADIVRSGHLLASKTDCDVRIHDTFRKSDEVAMFNTNTDPTYLEVIDVTSSDEGKLLIDIEDAEKAKFEIQ